MCAFRACATYQVEVWHPLCPVRAEYFQWSPTYNQNSKAISVSAGDVLYGSVTLDESTNTYHVYHSDLNTTQSVTFDIKIQNGPDGKPKTFDHAFIVRARMPCGPHSCLAHIGPCHATCTLPWRR